MLGFLYRIIVGYFIVHPPCQHRYMVYKEYDNVVTHDRGYTSEYTTSNPVIVSRCEICGAFKKEHIT